MSTNKLPSLAIKQPSKRAPKPRGLTPSDSTAVHRPPPTRRARKCACCHTSYTPRASHQRFCCKRCRQRSWAARHKADRAAKAERAALVTTCHYCGGTFWTASPAARYCSASHRTMACRRRREAAIEAVAQLGVPVPAAALSVEAAGLRRVSNVLGRLGLAYTPAARAWLPMAAAG